MNLQVKFDLLRQTKKTDGTETQKGKQKHDQSPLGKAPEQFWFYFGFDFIQYFPTGLFPRIQQATTSNKPFSKEEMKLFPEGKSHRCSRIKTTNL